MTKLSLDRKSIRILFIGYILVALFGTFILMLPIMHTKPISFLDAFFTSASGKYDRTYCIKYLTRF